MASLLFPQNTPPRANNPLAMINQFKEFARGMSPEGARRRVEELLKSGKMSQEQFKQIQEQANSFMSLLK